MKETLKEEMEKNFRPEFLNRVDDIIVFRSLTKDDLKHIIDIELAQGRRSGCKEKGLTLELTDEAKEFLIEKGTSLEYGARPLRRAIEQYLEDPLAEELLRGNFAGKDTDHRPRAGCPRRHEKRLTFEATGARPKRRRSWSERGKRRSKHRHSAKGLHSSAYREAVTSLSPGFAAYPGFYAPKTYPAGVTLCRHGSHDATPAG